MVEQPNVASINYKDQEAAFLAGVAAGLTTKTNKLLSSGWNARTSIRQIEAGFKAGVKAVNPNATVEIQYAESFSDAAKLNLSRSNVPSDFDMIYAAGGAWLRWFAAAKIDFETNPDRKIG